MDHQCDRVPVRLFSTTVLRVRDLFRTQHIRRVLCPALRILTYVQQRVLDLKLKVKNENIQLDPRRPNV